MILLDLFKIKIGGSNDGTKYTNQCLELLFKS